MARRASSQDPEEARKDLLATLAASRELGPEMDRALAESYLERNRSLAPTPRQVPAVSISERFGSLSEVALVAVLFAGYLGVLALTHSWGLWWLIFPLMGFAFGGGHGAWGGRHHHRRRARERRWERDGSATCDDDLPPRRAPSARPLPPTSVD